MFFRGRFYPEKLMVCESYNNEYDVSVIGFEGINSMTFDDGKFPPFYPARMKTTFIDAVNESEMAEVISDIDDGCVLVINVAKGFGIVHDRMEAKLYKSGKFINAFIGRSTTEIIQQTFLFNIEDVSTFSDPERIKIMMEVEEAFADKTVVFINSQKECGVRDDLAASLLARKDLQCTMSICNKYVFWSEVLYVIKKASGENMFEIRVHNPTEKSWHEKVSFEAIKSADSRKISEKVCYSINELCEYIVESV